MSVLGENRVNSNSSSILVIEGPLKFRENGKKWKSRWALLTKLSPVADCLQLQLYKDEKERLKPNGQTKASLSIQDCLAVEEVSSTIDCESHILSIFYSSSSGSGGSGGTGILLAFDSRERLIQWSVRVSSNFFGGNEEKGVQVFDVDLVSSPKSSSPVKTSKAKGRREVLKLHVSQEKFCLTEGGLRLVGCWKVGHLRRYGVLDNKIVFEGGSRCGKGGEGVHVLVPLDQFQIPLIIEALNYKSTTPSAPVVSGGGVMRRSSTASSSASPHVVMSNHHQSVIHEGHCSPRRCTSTNSFSHILTTAMVNHPPASSSPLLISSSSSFREATEVHQQHLDTVSLHSSCCSEAHSSPSRRLVTNANFHRRVGSASNLLTNSSLSCAPNNNNSSDVMADHILSPSWTMDIHINQESSRIQKKQATTIAMGKGCMSMSPRGSHHALEYDSPRSVLKQQLENNTYHASQEEVESGRSYSHTQTDSRPSSSSAHNNSHKNPPPQNGRQGFVGPYENYDVPRGSYLVEPEEEKRPPPHAQSSSSCGRNRNSTASSTTSSKGSASRHHQHPPQIHPPDYDTPPPPNHNRRPNSAPSNNSNSCPCGNTKSQNHQNPLLRLDGSYDVPPPQQTSSSSSVVQIGVLNGEGRMPLVNINNAMTSSSSCGLYDVNISNIPIYAAVDKSKKTRNQQLQAPPKSHNHGCLYENTPPPQHQVVRRQVRPEPLQNYVNLNFAESLDIYENSGLPQEKEGPVPLRDKKSNSKNNDPSSANSNPIYENNEEATNPVVNHNRTSTASNDSGVSVAAACCGEEGGGNSGSTVALPLLPPGESGQQRQDAKSAESDEVPISSTTIIKANVAVVGRSHFYETIDEATKAKITTSNHHHQTQEEEVKNSQSRSSLLMPSSHTNETEAGNPPPKAIALSCLSSSSLDSSSTSVSGNNAQDETQVKTGGGTMTTSSKPRSGGEYGRVDRSQF